MYRELIADKPSCLRLLVHDGQYAYWKIILRLAVIEEVDGLYLTFEYYVPEKCSINRLVYHVHSQNSRLTFFLYYLLVYGEGNPDITLIVDSALRYLQYGRAGLGNKAARLICRKLHIGYGELVNCYQQAERSHKERLRHGCMILSPLLASLPPISVERLPNDRTPDVPSLAITFREQVADALGGLGDFSEEEYGEITTLTEQFRSYTAAMDGVTYFCAALITLLNRIYPQNNSEHWLRRVAIAFGVNMARRPKRLRRAPSSQLLRQNIMRLFAFSPIMKNG
jgi:hypothetical protein